MQSVPSNDQLNAVSSAGPPPSQEGNHSTESRVLPFEFTGTGSEYFRIWIVNVLLSLVTLGVYSAWAKVRRKNYFYRNTHLDNATFEYKADPIKILKGRLIVGSFFLLSLIFQQVSPLLYTTVTLLFVGCIPAILVLSMSFNARYSVYRNVHFAFHGHIGESYRTFLLAGLWYVLTLGLGFPYAQWLMTKFVVNHHGYGDQKVHWKATAGQFYKVFFVSLLFVVPGLIVLGISVAQATSEAMQGNAPINHNQPFAAALPGLIAFYAGILVAAGYAQAKVANIVYGGVTLGEHRLCADQSALAVIWILLSNALAVVLSLGLLFPWAKVRLARYRCEHLVLLARGDLLAGNDLTAPGRGPWGDAASDLGDLDFDIGF